jgi:hypothetical protein
MTREEHFHAMEAIRADLSKDDAEVESLSWHEEALKKTEARVASGEERITDWSAAKGEPRKRSEYSASAVWSRLIRRKLGQGERKL